MPVDLPLRAGARLFVPAGTLPGDESWNLSLLDANGDRVETMFRCIWHRDGTDYVGWDHKIPSDADCQLRDVLPPGNYTLELQAEGEPIRVIPLAVSSGERVILSELIDERERD